MTPEAQHLAWHKASYSSGNNGCVEIAQQGGQVFVRDSKLGVQSPILSFSADEWACFVAGIRAGELS